MDALRRKRVKRLGIRATGHNGQRRIFFILDRGTRKFPGEVDLWMHSMEYARRQKAHKKLSQILTNVLRLHPTKTDLWIYAAQFAMDEHADITEARSYMQRGLRFCKNSKKMWLEYGKLEMLYIAKIAARRQILGIDKPRSGGAPTKNLDDSSADVLSLTTLTKEHVNPSLVDHDDVDEVALRTLDSTPVMSGAIPIAIFDAAMAQFQNDASVGKAFFDACSEFERLPCLRNILDYIVEVMTTSRTQSWEAQACSIKVVVAGLEVLSAEFPAGLSVSLSRLKHALAKTIHKAQLAEDVSSWLELMLETDGLDPALQKVISGKKRSLEQVSGPEKLENSMPS